jgi:hypothetical protein
MKIDIPLEDIVKEVKRLVIESPENVYKKPLDDGDNNCSYSKGICTNGAVGCIFGQALKNLGINTSTLDDASSIYGLYEITSDSDKNLLNWCVSVQSAQDNGKTWGKAVEDANKRHFPV